MKALFAGGGTGGHLMAGLSIAEELSSRFPGTDIIFFGTNKEKEAAYVEKSGYRFKQIRTCKRTSFFYLPIFALVSVFGVINSLINIIKIKPDVVIGLGGYGSVVPVFAAYLIGVPIVLIEQNVVPGRANRFMARWVDVVLCHWESTVERFKKVDSVHVTGIPIRRNIIKGKSDITTNIFGLDSEKRTLLIMGGSQGARAINNEMLQISPRLKALLPDLQIIHVTGEHGYNEARNVYKTVGIKAFVAKFIDDIGSVYELSNLVICRAGANTTAEISAVGIPAIFIPYPYATDNHQYWNAHELARRGGALIINQKELKSEKTIGLITSLLMNDEKLNNMKTINKTLDKPFAAAKVAEAIMQTLEVKKAGKNLFFGRRNYIGKNEAYLTKTI